MPHLNLFAISGLFIAITTIPFLIVIATQGKTRFTKIFSLHVLVVCMWGISAFLLGINESPSLVIPRKVHPNCCPLYPNLFPACNEPIDWITV